MLPRFLAERRRLVVASLLLLALSSLPSSRPLPRASTSRAVTSAPVISPLPPPPSPRVSPSLPASSYPALPPSAALAHAAHREDPLSRFSAWLTAHQRSESPPLSVGVTLARQRRIALRSLIATDPRAALAHAVPRTLRASLPADILAELETPIDATGRLEVLSACSGTRGEVSRTTIIGDRRFVAHTFGQRLATLTKNNLALHGIALDDQFALSAEPFRRLEPAELPHASSPAASAALVVAVGDTIQEFASEADLARWHRTTAAAEASPNSPSRLAIPDDGAAPSTAAAPPDWTIGEKSVLWIRAEYAGDSGLVTTDNTITTAMSAVNDYFRDVSRGRSSFRTTIVPGAVRLSRDRAYYNAGTGRIAELESEALRLAREYDAANGGTGAFNPDRHDRWIIVFKELTVYWWAGTAFVGDKGVRLNGYMQPAIIAHELGHNHGLPHSHAWKPYEGSTIGHGEHVEYGDPFDIMGGGSSIPEGHFNTTHKQTLLYLAENEIATVTASGTHRLYRHDDRNASGLQVLKIPAGRYEYSIEHRRTAPRPNHPHAFRLESGLLLRWSKVPSTFSGRGTYLLDGTPTSPAAMDDAPLGLEETFTDARRGFSVTPVATGGEGATAWIDVRVDFGATGNNRNPVITAAAPAPVVPVRTDVTLRASATDPDGDPVSYLWEIGDEEITSTTPTLDYRWIAGGSYTVKCSALDGRGGYASQTFNVTVEDPLANWTRRGQGAISGSFYAATHVRNQFILVGNAAATSPDGITWTRGTVPSSVLYRDIAYNETSLVAAGYRPASGTTYLALGLSADGRNWQDVSPPATTGDFYGIAYGAGRFVAVGRDGAMLQSADGFNWSRPAIDNSRTLRAIRYAAGRFLAVGDAGTVFVSTDGLAWQNRSVQTANFFYAVTYHRGEWIVGSGAEAWHSTDHTATWVRSFPPERPIFHEMLSTTGSELLLMSHVATDELFVSETGHRWATVPIKTPKTANYQWTIAEANGTVVIAGNNSLIYQTSLRTSLVAPTIATPPRAQSAATSQTITLSVTASGGALSYQWFKDGASIAGATGVTYTIANATVAHSGSYTVAVTNLLGTVTSPAAVVTVDRRTVHVVQMAASRSASAGSEVVLTAVAGGRPPFTYQWRKDGVDLPDATAASLTLKTALPSDAGSYTVVITDDSGSITSSPAILTVTGAIPFAVSSFAGSLRATGTTDGPGSEARFSTLGELALDSLGNLYISDRTGHTIRKITPGGVVTTFAGRAGGPGFFDGAGTAAVFNLPNGLAVDRAGNVFVCDTNNNRIRRITPAGVVTTFAGQFQGAVDATGAAARFGLPAGLTIDADGNLYCTEGLNHTVRKITPAGVVTTFAGTARASGFLNGRGAEARFNFNSPSGLTVDAAGNLFVADAGNHVIRKITPDGLVTTFAGIPGSLGSNDGPAATARFVSPRSVAFDSSGNLFVTSSSTVRRISPDGMVTTPLGAAGSITFADGVGNTARFSTLSGIKVDPLGNLFLADNSNTLVRKATPLGRQGSRLANLSVRTRAGTDAETLIVGFNLAGGTKPLLVRAVGPTLGAFGVADTLADPSLQLDNSTGLLARNDDWHAPATGTATLVSNAAASVGAFALPAASRDAALFQSLSAGSYTAQVGGGTGTALVEVYDAAPTHPAKLANVSARTRAGSGSDALFLGFVVAGDSPRTVLIRAIGPALAAFGVSDTLGAPRLELLRDTTVVAENSGWPASAAMHDAFTRVGAFALPPDSRDAALLVTLLPGAYTTQVTAATGAPGITLVEVYDVP